MKKRILPHVKHNPAFANIWHSYLPIVEQFVNLNCIKGKGLECKFSSMYEEYIHWAYENNQELINRNVLAGCLTKLGFKSKFINNQGAFRQGIAIK